MVGKGAGQTVNIANAPSQDNYITVEYESDEEALADIEDGIKKLEGYRREIRERLRLKIEAKTETE